MLHDGHKELGHEDKWKKKKKFQTEETLSQRNWGVSSVPGWGIVRNVSGVWWASWRTLDVEIIEVELGEIWIEGLTRHFKGPAFHSQREKKRHWKTFPWKGQNEKPEYINLNET